MKNSSDTTILVTLVLALCLFSATIFSTTILYDFVLYLKPNSVWYREGVVCFLIISGIFK